MGVIAFLNFFPVFWIYKLFQITHYTAFNIYLKSVFKDSFLVNDIEKNFINEVRFNQLQNYKYFIAAGSFILIVLITSLFINVLAKIPFPTKEAKQSYSKKMHLYTFGFFCLWLIYKTFLFVYIPLHIDEMFDFVFYAKSNIITRHTYIFNDGVQWYNNHLLYSDFSAIFYSLDFPNKLAMRLPSILGELSLFTFLWFRFREDGIIKTLFITLVLATSFWASVYSVEARSYYLLGVCTVICFFLVNDLNKKPSHQQFLAFVLLSLIGFGLSKLYIIPFLGISFFVLILQKDRTMISFWIRTFSFITLLTILFYIPSYLIGGGGSISPKGIRLYPLIFEGISVITNISTKAYLGLLFSGVFLLVVYKKVSVLSQRLILFVGFQFVSITIFTLASRVFLPERAFVYLNLCYYILLAFVLWDLLRERKKWLFITLAFLILHTIYNYNYSWLAKNKSFILGREYYGAMAKAGTRLKLLNNRTLYIETGDYSVFIFAKFYALDDLAVKMADELEPQTNFLSSEDLNIKEYDKIILDPDFDIFLYKKRED